MADAFTGIRLKLQRAREHLDELKGEFDAFLDSDPYRPHIDFYPETGELTVTAYIDKHPNPMWGVRLGEIIHNTRSALDHAVWLLSSAKTRKNQFPIFDTEAGFKARGVPLMLEGVSSAAVDLIRSEQPFSTGEGHHCPLWHLSELSNVDKHRTLHVTGTTVASFKARFPPLLQDVTITTYEIPGPGPIQQDAVIWYGVIKGATSWPFAHADVDGELLLNIAFERSIPAPGVWLVYPTLDDVLERVRRVLGRVSADMFGLTL